MKKLRAACQLRNLASCIAILMTWQFVFPYCAAAQGNLLLMPRRIVFEGSKRYEEINLANTGKDTARYVISIMHVRMQEDGSFIEITEPGAGENFADKYIRFFPHSVTLGPDESQVVKIQLNRSNELTAGEYRSHIYFRAIPGAAPLGEKQTAADSAIFIKLVPVFGISIPVIIRVGEVNTEVSLTDPSVEMAEDTIPVLNMTFLRKGNMSIYGDLSVDYISEQGKTISAGTIKGIAVYTPNLVRRFKLNLEKHPGIDYHSGKLHITYSTPAESKLTKIAETDLVLH
ncbi:MAG: molecular chaperone [Bacteroidota bacterium]